MPRKSRIDDLLSSMDGDGVAVRRLDIVRRFGRTAFEQARAWHRIVEILPGVFALGKYADSLLTRIAAASRWVGPRGAVGGSAACTVYGLEPRNPVPITVVVGESLHLRTPAWLSVRRCRRFPSVYERRGIGVVPPPDALILAWRDEGPDDARGLVLDAVRERVVTPGELFQALPSHPRIQGRGALTDFLAHLRDGVDSYLEYIADTTVLNTPDLRVLVRQYVVRVSNRRFRVDAFDEETRTAVEFDGARYHGSDEARRRDRERDVVLASAGVQTLRFTFRDVIDRPVWCREQIRRTLISRRGIDRFGAK